MANGLGETTHRSFCTCLVHNTDSGKRGGGVMEPQCKTLGKSETTRENLGPVRWDGPFDTTPSDPMRGPSHWMSDWTGVKKPPHRLHLNLSFVRRFALEEVFSFSSSTHMYDEVVSEATPGPGPLTPTLDPTDLLMPTLSPGCARVPSQRLRFSLPQGLAALSQGSSD